MTFYSLWDIKTLELAREAYAFYLDDIQKRYLALLNTPHYTEAEQKAARETKTELLIKIRHYEKHLTTINQKIKEHENQD